MHILDVTLFKILLISVLLLIVKERKSKYNNAESELNISIKFLILLGEKVDKFRNFNLGQLLNI